MITKEIAVALHHGKTLYHVSMKNADKSALRVRVNGNCQTWKTRPAEFKLPIKHGMYQYGYITEKNGNEWTTEEPEAVTKNRFEIFDHASGKVEGPFTLGTMIRDNADQKELIVWMKKAKIGDTCNFGGGAESECVIECVK